MQYYFVGQGFQNKLIIDQILHTNKHYDNYGCKTNLKECLLKENIFAYAVCTASMLLAKVSYFNIKTIMFKSLYEIKCL